MAEIFLQDLEQHQLKHMLEDGKITHYNRYVDDIFIIYNKNKTKNNPPNHIRTFQCAT
jgi:hypothetical protein